MMEEDGVYYSGNCYDYGLNFSIVIDSGRNFTVFATTLNYIYGIHLYGPDGVEVFATT